MENQLKKNQSDKSLKKILSAKQKELKALIKKMTDTKRMVGSKFNTNLDVANLKGIESMPGLAVVPLVTDQ